MRALPDQLCTDREFNCCSLSCHTRPQVSTYDWSRRTDWAGLARHDQGTSERCEFSSNYMKNDTVIRPVGSEEPEQFHATERRGNTLKGETMPVSKDTYTPARKSRNMSSNRVRTYEFFIRSYSDEEVKHAASSMAACVITCYPVGDSVSYRDEARTSEHGPECNSDPRPIGLKKETSSPSDATKHVLGNLRLRVRSRYRWSFMFLYCGEIVGFSQHANQRFIISRGRRSDTTRLHR